MPTQKTILRDLRVFNPQPRGYVTVEVEGREPVDYAIRSIVDMKEKEALQLLELDNVETGGPISSVSWAEATRVLESRIMLICPDMTEEALGEMTRRQKTEFWLAAIREKAPPLYDQLRLILDLYGRFQMPCPEGCMHPECMALGRIKEVASEFAPL